MFFNYNWQLVQSLIWSYRLECWGSGIVYYLESALSYTKNGTRAWREWWRECFKLYCDAYCSLDQILVPHSLLFLMGHAMLRLCGNTNHLLANPPTLIDHSIPMKHNNYSICVIKSLQSIRDLNCYPTEAVTSWEGRSVISPSPHNHAAASMVCSHQLSRLNVV